ncbi:MAG: lysine exporter LysO family protein [Patescibacteria group bacterium]
MKDSIIIVFFFIFGVFIGLYVAPPFFANDGLSSYALYFLMFLVGISVGADGKTVETLKKINFKIVLVPLCVIVGSLAGGIIGAFLLTDVNILEGMIVSAGFGYYSLSSILITTLYSDTLGVVALLSNIMREVATLLLAPLFAYYFKALAPIAAGGATAMDTTLPIITRAVGKHYAFIAVFSGVILTVLVPFLVTFLIRFAT